MGQKQSNVQKSNSKSPLNQSSSPKANVKFTWRDSSHRHETVSFVSSFNGWDPIPLKYNTSSKDWSVIVNAPQGTSTYRYIVDGEYKYDNTKNHIIDKDGRYSNVIRLSVNTNSTDKSPKQSNFHQNPNYRNVINDNSSRNRSRSGPPRPLNLRQPNEAESPQEIQSPLTNGANSPASVKKSKSADKLKPSDPENPEGNVWGQEEYEFPVKRKYPPYLPPHTSFTLLNVAPGEAFNNPASVSKNVKGKTIRWSDLEPLHVTLNHMYFAKSPRSVEEEERSYIEMGLSTKYRGKSTIYHIFRPKDLFTD